MQSLENQKLPLCAAPLEFELSQDFIAGFQKAFQWKSSSIPPTFAARAFSGMFQLLKELEVDWRGLLHTSQSFEYLRPFYAGQKLLAESQLSKYRFRAGVHWLQFESRLCDRESGDEVLRARSLILVEDKK